MRYERRHNSTDTMATIADCKLSNSSFVLIRHSSFDTHLSSPIAHPVRRGVTLVEMLVVLAVLMILMLVTLKVVEPVADRRVREAARQVNVYLSSARNMAMELGRPCGVIFQRAVNTNFNRASTVLQQYMIPPPYAGDTVDAVVEVQRAPNLDTYDGNGNRLTIACRVRIRYPPVDISPKMIFPGDQIQFNNQGPYYTVQESDQTLGPPDFPPDADGYFQFSNLLPKEADGNGDGYIDNYCLTVAIDVRSSSINYVPWPTVPNWSQPVAFQVLRAFDKTPVSTLQLPAGTLVDLTLSGPGNGTFDPDPQNRDIGIVFSSNGGIEGYHAYSAYYNKYGGWRTGTPIYFLIGQTKGINPITGSDTNDDDLSNLWVTVNHLTGLVSTDEMAVGGNLSAKRQYARQSQSMGGR